MKTRKNKTNNKEEIATLIKAKVYGLFDRIPNGSIKNEKVAELVEEIIKLK